MSETCFKEHSGACELIRLLGGGVPPIISYVIIVKLRESVNLQETRMYLLLMCNTSV